MSEKLKPCPFCGSSHVLAEDFEEFDMGMYWIRCGDCGAGCSTKDTTEEAIKAWNRRANDVGQ
jgi:Lar family restriction alleviation protein